VSCPRCNRPSETGETYCSAKCFWADYQKKLKEQRRPKAGKRADLGGLYVRSSWEANYCRYLNWLIQQRQIGAWAYEPDLFEFTSIKKGVRFYLPDFKILCNDGSFEYHEVKGFMDHKSKVKLKRMAQFYPHIKLVLIDAPVYRALERDVKGLIDEWE
jgi:hypothetical protein